MAGRVSMRLLFTRHSLQCLSVYRTTVSCGFEFSGACIHLSVLAPLSNMTDLCGPQFPHCK